MIQRIQTLWLALIFIIAIGMAYLFQKENILLIISALSAALSVVAILRYKDRSRQITLCYILIVLEVVAAVLLCLPESILAIGFGDLSNVWFLLGIWSGFFPVAEFLLTLLALRAIKKDEKLVRSMDRLR
ncbi:MAG: DUF4293 domain-containing protein [Candidatus Symbiothrix sp.]|jgi:hypothetical protein|nr:DUF4293 domain-containing protein [Candidatus Symbiothrix sp.]